MNSEIIIYQNPEGNIKIDVRLEEETVWLTQKQMATLFGKAKSTINEHIKNIYEEQELEESTSMKKFGISGFQQKAPNFYNLDVIISVGYRVKSPRGTQFQITNSHFYPFTLFTVTATNNLCGRLLWITPFSGTMSA